MTVDDWDGMTALLASAAPPGPPELGDAYVHMIAGARDFLDALAGARVDVAQSLQLRADLERWASTLHQLEVSERDRLWGHWTESPGRGQTLVPQVYDQSMDGFELTAKVVFGRYHVGENMAVHGGAVSLLFDDVLGWLGFRATRDGSALPPSRTASLTVNYRSVTPVGEELLIRGRIERIDGRKRFLRGELVHGDVLCADAEGLWIELKPGQR